MRRFVKVCFSQAFFDRHSSRADQEKPAILMLFGSLVTV